MEGAGDETAAEGSREHREKWQRRWDYSVIMGGNCTCLNKEEAHEVTVDKKPGASLRPSDTAPSIASTSPPLTEKDLVLLLQNSFRSYLSLSQMKTLFKEYTELEEAGEREEVEGIGEVEKGQIPPLSPEAEAKMRKLKPFRYDLKVVMGIPKGPILLTDDSVYVGEWKDGQRYGKGVCYLSSGAVMEGYWSHGLHRKGRTVYFNGDLYEGEYHHGLKEGRGRFEDSTGEIAYIGEWKADGKHGYGEETMVDGSTYHGHFKQDMKSGHGVFKWPSGEMYEGEFQENKIHGRGKYTWNDEKWYDGDWFEGSMHGYGRLLAEGKEYEGEFVKDKKHGKGTLKWSGNTYEGDFVNNRMHGVGWLSQVGKPRKLYAFDSNKRLSEIQTSQ